MSTSLINTQNQTGVSDKVLEMTLLHGDLSGLDPTQRVEYMTAVCKCLGINPLTKPFEFITLKNKLIMYAKRDCAEQLRKLHAVSIEITSRELLEDTYVVTARARDKTGRTDESIGALSLAGLKGEDRANAMMKAETKAKRRVTLSICGLGMLDETEIESIPDARPLTSEPVRISTIEIPAVSASSTEVNGNVVPALRALERPAPVQNQDEHEGFADYVVPKGKYKNQRLGDIDLEEIKGYVRWFYQDAQKNGKEISGWVTELVQAVKAYEIEQEDKIPL